MVQPGKIPIWVSRGQKATLPYLCLKDLRDEMPELTTEPPQGGDRPGRFQAENQNLISLLA